MVMFWISLLAISILLYVLLEGVDLGVGLLFGLAKGEARLSAVAPSITQNLDRLRWLFRCVPRVYCCLGGKRARGQR
jgi:hypothetical protein